MYSALKLKLINKYKSVFMKKNLYYKSMPEDIQTLKVSLNENISLKIYIYKKST